MDEIRERLEHVRQSIRIAAEQAQQSEVITLVAVTKTIAPARVLEAYEAGQRHFGENRVQEAIGKIESLAGLMPHARWRLVGHLQTNKTGPAARVFALIESVDSIRLAEKLNAEAGRIGRRLPILAEVNVAGEVSKSGFSVDTFWTAVPKILELQNLDLIGLMTIAPHVSDPTDVRWVFRKLRELRDATRQKFNAPQFSQLSMGMSNDFEVAVKEGATMVRIGRAIFGERQH